MFRKLVTSMLIASTSCCAAAEWKLEPLWETAAGLQNPESVVYDRGHNVLIVSNVAGNPTDKDGNGFLSLINLDGGVRKIDWVTGLNAPKGLAIAKGRLYVADIDVVHEIDTDTGQIRTHHRIEGAKFLNDVAADGNGYVYVSDMAKDVIHRKVCCGFDTWLASAKLEGPNGLTVAGDKMYVGSWGAMEADMSTKVPGRVKMVDLETKTIHGFGSARSIGNMDGIERLSDGSILASDWVAGTVMTVAANGKVTKLASPGPGSADLTYLAKQSLVLVPMMKDNKLNAYRIKRS